MVILVIASVSETIQLGTKPCFTVPTRDAQNASRARLLPRRCAPDNDVFRGTLDWRQSHNFDYDVFLLDGSVYKRSFRSRSPIFVSKGR